MIAGFEIGKSYKCVLSKPSSKWVKEMNVVTDGKPRKCLAVGTSNSLFAELEGVSGGHWHWDACDFVFVDVAQCKDGFHIGDRVVMIKNHDSARTSMSGTVVTFSVNEDQPIGVEFDNEFSGGHTLSDECKDEHGHWVPGDCIKLIQDNNEDEDECDEDECDDCGCKSYNCKCEEDKEENTMDEFKLGDSVIVKDTYTNIGNRNPTGCKTGKIVCINGTRDDHTISIDFDVSIGGHNCDGKAKEECGWNIERKYIKLLVGGMKMEMKEVKAENLKEAKKQFAEERKNAEIEFAKQQLRNAIDRVNDYDRQIKALEESKKVYLDIIAKF